MPIWISESTKKEKKKEKKEDILYNENMKTRNI